MRTHQLVLQWIENQLSDGQLAVGGRLPAERSLAEQLQVSRTSVREAIRVLEAMGVVRAGVGSGPDAGTIVISDPTAALGSALRLHVATQHLPVADIVETRVLLESWAAAHIRPDAPQLEAAAALLDRMDAVGHSPDGTAGAGAGAPAAAAAPASAGTAVDEFLALDVHFHLALADAAGNAVVSAMMGSLREAIQGYAARLTANLPDWDATASRLREEHRGILAAIRNNDGGRAAELVAAHIEGYYREAGVERPHGA
ncbi:FCD domain-containing protein [Pseudarthrobacter sp. J64]|uniref:FadR/GntR family transcriptional regulator n=1 Tax=Pseudarthrobacter sp. J64 TaxID=3116485 RepID=UPI002E8182B5|nr:FCD domain-containing protein [Pseudarthrobacter sp. J64]MEE2567813.1 FCD domain-containing protein [Pseudarthrobacter sp. J64]